MSRIDMDIEASRTAMRAAMADSGNPKDAIGDTKPQYHLIPTGALAYIAKVMSLGAKKYGPFNWRKQPVRYTVYVSAALRHIYSALDGEDLDGESGQPHIAHAASCMAILLDAMACQTLIDDRPQAGASAILIRQMTETAAAPVAPGGWPLIKNVTAS